MTACTRTHTHTHSHTHTQAASEAEVLIRQEQRSFEGWRDSLETVPTIKALRSKVLRVTSMVKPSS
jgi:glutamyl-tRNA reductase